MAEETRVALGGEMDDILRLAELQARRAGSRELEVRHLALALALHPHWREPFQELGLNYEALHSALLEGAGKDAAFLPAQEAAEVLGKAGKLAGSRGRGITGGHLLRAILESRGAVAQAIAREAGVPLDDLLNKPELLHLPAHMGLLRSTWARLLARLRRLGGWTVLAFAWSGLWAGLLYLLTRWVLGPTAGNRYFCWIVLVVGAGSALGLAVYQAWRTFGRQKQGKPGAKPKAEES